MTVADLLGNGEYRREGREGPPYHGILCPEQDIHCPGSSCLEGSVVGDFVGSTIRGLKTIVHIGSTVQVVCLLWL